MRLTLTMKIVLLLLILILLGAVSISYVNFQMIDALLFVVGPQVDQDTLQQALGAYRRDWWQVILLIGVILGVVTHFSVRWLMRPVNCLNQAVRMVALGDHPTNLPDLGDDDVGVLSRTLQTMAEQLSQTHAELSELHFSLEQQVEVKTRDLITVRDQALAASHAKSEFLATMSHEIRTPMNVVLGMLELLREAPLDHDRLEQVRLAYGSGKTLLALIDNVLDFSKIESGHLTLDEVDFDLRALVDESALILATLAHGKEIELIPFFPHGMPTAVRGDINRLRQIFTNLLGNAIKFTPEGGTVELHGGPVSAEIGDKTEYLFEVRDTGLGVPEAERERIFDRFIQIENQTSRENAGAGLGLAISKRLVELMGGDIGVDVNPYASTGSVFHFTVQLTKQLHVPVDDSVRGAFEGLRVLGVEVDGLQRLFLEDVFALFGAQFNYVAEVERAVEILRQAKSAGSGYDVVVLNQRPGQDSRRASRQLRNVEFGSRFMLLTDLLDQGLDQAVDLPGVAICLKKPVSAERLHSAIGWLLQANDGEQRVVVTPAKQVIPVLYDARVLIVDDHAANLTVARGMLVRLGCDPDQLFTVADGRAGLALFVEKPFHLVFMDCQMPGMDGYEASRLMRQCEQEQQRVPAPIVAFTANVTAGNRERGKEAGMDDFLAKPVTLNELNGVLERFLTPRMMKVPAVAEAEFVPPTDDEVKPDGGQSDLSHLLMAMASIGLPEEDFKDVAGLLSSQIPELLGSLKQDLNSGEYESARATAHVLKGSMVNTIFPQLQTHTRQLYEKIKKKSWSDAQDSLGVLQTQFAPVQRALEMFLG